MASASEPLPDFFAGSPDELRLAAKAALAAGRIIDAGRGKLLAIDQKSAGDLVSEIDIQADREIAQVLRSSGIAILSEELTPDTDLEEMWIVDPLDASSSYLMGGAVDEPSVLVALRSAGRVVLGLAYFPLTGEWFYAMQGQGAWFEGRPLRVPQPPAELSASWVEMNAYGDSRYETTFFRNARNSLRSVGGARAVTCGFPCSGKALRLALPNSWLAAVVHDNGPENLKQGPWDIAAVQLILEEAGGVFVNRQMQRINPFVPEPIIAASSEKLARQLLQCTESGSHEQAARGRQPG